MQNFKKEAITEEILKTFSEKLNDKIKNQRYDFILTDQAYKIFHHYCLAKQDFFCLPAYQYRETVICK